MTKLLLVLFVVSCDAQCDDRYHKAEDYKREPRSTHSGGVAPFVYVPMRSVGVL